MNIPRKWLWDFTISEILHACWSIFLLLIVMFFASLACVGFMPSVQNFLCIFMLCKGEP